MDRYNFYFRQKLNKTELNDAFDAVEAAINALIETNGYAGGVVDGADTSEHSPTPDLTVDVAPGIIYDQFAQRIAWSVLQVVDMSLDENGASTAVVSSGNEKWLSLFAEFERNATDPRTDGNGDTVFYDNAESFNLNVVQGTEAATGTATKPSLRSDQVLIADVLITYSMTQIQDSDIDLDRMEVPFDLSGSPNSIKAKGIYELAEELLALVNSVFTSGTFSGPVTFEDDVTFEAGLLLADTSQLYWDSVSNPHTPRMFFDSALSSTLSGDKLLLAQLSDEASGTRNLRLYIADEEIAIVSGAIWGGSTWSFDAGVSSAYKIALDGAMFRVMVYNGSSPWADASWDQGIRLNTAYCAITSGGDDVALFNTYGMTLEAASGEINYDDSREIVRQVSLAQGQGDWELTNQYQWLSAVNFGRLNFPLGAPPLGASDTITIDIMVEPGVTRATQTNRVRLGLYYSEPNWTTPATPSYTQIGSYAYDDGTTSVQKVTISNSFEPLTTRLYRLEIRGGNDAASNKDTLYAIRITCNAVVLKPGLIDV